MDQRFYRTCQIGVASAPMSRDKRTEKTTHRPNQQCKMVLHTATRGMVQDFRLSRATFVTHSLFAVGVV
ncbi:hypothetical protein M413DRAFT_445893 [Hebeloma cylindrosporum]|uniref:Uncharacterized protein n=1 Tax=Hebeloma cylindrosporum TaxID=76867 RepID=A0A0C3CC66_HEBCY|nr:hypothetical protein M413DRAFT_445893 [Hebeloma cylindrosporum h7]